MRRQSFLPIFFLFLVLSFGILFLSEKNLFPGVVGTILFPIESTAYNLFHVSFLPVAKSPQDSLTAQNQALLQQLTHLQSVEADNKALRDQFQITDIPSQTLIPAHIIGAPSFFPGVSLPENIVIDRGDAQGVHVGQVVIVKNILVGSVVKATSNASLVRLVSNISSLITAQTQETSAQGVVKGLGNGEMVLDNVSLSDQLKLGDMVVTGAGQDMSGSGYPPGLILGTISSIEKNPSSLFQKANIKSPFSITHLQMVFIKSGK